MSYFLIFLFSFFLSIIFTLIIKKLAQKFKILDRRESAPERKFQVKQIPLLGGLAIFAAFFLTIFILYKLDFLTPPFKFKNLIGIFLASSLLMFGGFLDDKYHLKPWQSVICPFFASLIVIAFGIGIEIVNNPFGQGLIHLDLYKIEIMRIGGIPYYFTPLADFFTFSWLMILMYSTKLLDGLDGLVAGLTTLSSLLIAGFCLFSIFFQPDLAKISLILAGASTGFLIFNFHPAKIFLGEGGSLFSGFILGIISIISGSKVAITFLIIGIAVLDLFWTLVRRYFIEHQLPFKADFGHLHHKLLDLGFSHRKAVLFYWFLSFIFGLSAIFLKTKGKIIVIGLLIVLIIPLLIFLEKEALVLKRIRKPL